MYRLLFFVLLFTVLIPIVWRIVNRVFFKVSNALFEGKADDAIESFLRQKNKIDERKRCLDEESIRAKEEVDKLSVFSNSGKKKQKRNKK